MAADILLYNAELVPIGIDNEPHLEVAREMARKFNGMYGTNWLNQNGMQLQEVAFHLWLEKEK